MAEAAIAAATANKPAVRIVIVAAHQWNICTVWG